MLAFPNVKINLGLYITEKRADNYHNLLTCFYPAPLNDILEIVPAARFEFVQTGLEIPGNQEDNLVVKAYSLLQKEFDLPPVRIQLHKLVPMGAGLGGGSSDAAFTLSTLNTQFQLGLKEAQLEEYAAKLGSDCAFFIRNRPVVAKGRGELMENCEVDLKGTHLFMVCPGLHVSTADAYGGTKPSPYTGDFEGVLKDKSKWRNELHNQFEDTIFPKHPTLASIKEQLYALGAWYAAMSGSGSTVFGLFEKEVTTHSFSYTTFQKGL